MAHKNILLIEPAYKNKYPPLGLMKLAQYHGPEGKRDYVRFIKGEDSSVLGAAWDRIYVTTLFSFEYQRIERSIDFALKVANGQASKVFVGGIAASLMNDRFRAVTKWHGIRFIKGLLTAPPAMALQLDDFAEELYSDDQRRLYCRSPTRSGNGWSSRNASLFQTSTSSDAIYWLTAVTPRISIVTSFPWHFDC